MSERPTSDRTLIQMLTCSEVIDVFHNHIYIAIKHKTHLPVTPKWVALPAKRCSNFESRSQTPVNLMVSETIVSEAMIKSVRAHRLIQS